MTTTPRELQQRIAAALCLDDDGPCGMCWTAASDVLPVVMEYAGHCKHCHHPLPDHDGYGRCCATVECRCHREGDE